MKTYTLNQLSKRMIVSFMSVIPFLGNAQLIVVQELVPIETKYADGWTAIVTNPMIPLHAYAELKISRSGQPWLLAKSAVFELPKGENRIDYTRLSIEQTSLKPNRFNWGGYMPQGNYEVCIYIKCIENAEEGESCLPLEIMPLSPPMLVSPANNESVDPLPMLTWMPPMPLNIYENLSYDLSLVEMRPMQSSYEAMGRNLPTFVLRNQTSFTYQYSPSNAPLQPGKNYAWQVTAIDNGRVIGKTEIWQFSVSKDSSHVKEELLPDYYYRLEKPGTPATAATAKGCLGFTCDEEPLGNLKIKLSDNKDKAIDTAGMVLKPAKQPNYYILYLNNMASIREKKSYKLTVIASSGKNYVLSFIYKKPELR